VIIFLGALLPIVQYPVCGITDVCYFHLLHIFAYKKCILLKYLIKICNYIDVETINMISCYFVHVCYLCINVLCQVEGRSCIVRC
jgi:hypothetical protein